jgi:hypothetical protein
VTGCERGGGEESQRKGLVNLKEGEARASGDSREGGYAWRGRVLLIALVYSVGVTLICQEKQAESHHEDWKERECEAQVIMVALDVDAWNAEVRHALRMKRSSSD